MDYWFDLDAVREEHKWTDKNGKRIGSEQLGARVKANKDFFNKKGSGGNYDYGGLDSREGVHNNPSGKNPGDVVEMNKEEWLEYCTYLWSLSQEHPDFFNINTQPFPLAHFAVFPEKLVEKPLLAGCPAEVCKYCGKARVRITNRTGEVNQQWGERKSKPWFDDKREMPQKVIKEGIYETIGWTDCQCEGGDKYQPGITLDPFGGSGTVSIEAEKLGRNSIYIDIKKDYCEMGIKRLKPLVEQTDLTGKQSTIERIGF